MFHRYACLPGRVLPALLALASPAAFAGTPLPPISGLITYAPDGTTTAVPTLSEWGLLAMVLLLAVVAYRVLRAQMGAKPLASVVLAGALGLGLASGVPLVRPALAVEYPTLSVPLTEAAGGFAGFAAASTYYLGLEVVNNSGVPQRITGMEVDLPYVFSDSGLTPQCTVGLRLSIGGKCYVGVGGGGPPDA